MANPSRAKGTAWETELLPRMRVIFGPQVERAPLKGSQDAGDFVGVPFPVEAKSTKKPLFLQWARRLQATPAYNSTFGRWVLFWHGDRRDTAVPELAVMPAEFAERLLRINELHERASFTAGEGLVPYA